MSWQLTQNSGFKRNKLLDDAHRVAKGLSGQRLGRLRPKGGNANQVVTIRRLEAQVAELTHIMVAKNLVKPS